VNESKLPSSTVGFEDSGKTSRTKVDSELFASVERIITSSFPFHARIAFCPDSCTLTSLG